MKEILPPIQLGMIDDAIDHIATAQDGRCLAQGANVATSCQASEFVPLIETV